MLEKRETFREINQAIPLGKEANQQNRALHNRAVKNS
jgi:hypothetical protein